jgi:hypothetical protein
MKSRPLPLKQNFQGFNVLDLLGKPIELMLQPVTA